MSLSVIVQSQILRINLQPKSSLYYFRTLPGNTRIRLPGLPASRSKVSSNFMQDGSILVGDSRSWSRSISSNYDREEEEEEDDDDDEGEDRSLDLLIRFVQNVFRKVSKRTRKAVRSVLPRSIPTKLVVFSVDGTLILAFLWVLKAFVEVVCTVGSVVFVSILLIRGIWSGITYIQESKREKMDDQWSGVQPVT